MTNPENPLAYRLVSRLAKVKPIEDENTCPNTNAKQLIVGYAALSLIKLEDGSYIAIDGGTDIKAKKISNFLKQSGKCLDDIRAVYVTHAHYDHLGLVAATRGSNTQTYISKADSHVLTGDQHSEGLIPRLGEYYKSLAYLAGVKPETVEPNEEHQYGNIAITAIATRGHTSGSMSYAIETPTGSAIYIGDALDNGYNGIQLPPSFLSYNLIDAKRSVNLIREYANEHPGAMIYPAHSAGMTAEQFIVSCRT